MSDNSNKLPAAWTKLPIEKLFAPLEDGRVMHQGWSPQCEKEPSPSEDQWGVLRTTSIQAGEFQPEHNKLLPSKLDPRPLLEVKPGDILLTCAGPRNRCGISCLVRNTRSRLMISGKMYRFRAKPDAIESGFLESFLQTEEAKQAIDRMKTGGSDSGLNLTHERFRQLPVPVAPLPEQRRIVAEIEKQFTRLEAGVAALRRVQANLKRYRAAVLKAACEGRLVLTEAELQKSEGRSQKSKAKFETGAELLARILTERRQNWQGRGQYKEPVPPDSANIPPSLPEGWACASVDQITENLDGRRVPLKSADRDKRSGQYPYYGASGIIDDIDDFLFDGEYLLIAEDGANLISRSTPIAFKATGRFWVNNHAHIVQTRGGIPLAYLSIFLNGKDISFSVTGSAQPKLTQAALNKTPVPLPPLAEQTRIVAEVERRLSVVEELESVVTANLQRATRLRQSILQKAFSGKL